MNIELHLQKKIHSANGLLTLDVEADIGSGELVSLFGPSGAGKTTLLRMIAGLVLPDSGRLVVGGEVWFDSKFKINLPPQARNIGYVFQDYALFPNMSVAENIGFAQSSKDSAQLNRLLEMFGLTELRKRKPASLSGGQKQRVALARALARTPKILLLDEPLSALDADMRVALQDEIVRVHRLTATTTLLVSHDLNEVFRLSTKVFCIDNGLLSRKGTPEEVFSDNSISGKFQVTGQVVRIEKQDVVNVVTVVTGSNSIVKVIAMDSELETISVGSRVMVFTKAFNPIITNLS